MAKVTLVPGLPVFECQDCGMFMVDRDMESLPEKGILERVSPGEPMPYGQCPECGGVVHQAEVVFKTLILAGRINQILRSDCSARSLDDEGDRAITALILAGALERS